MFRDGSVRALLAILVVTAGFAVFAFTNKLDFSQLLVLVNPPILLYFGQYITPPTQTRTAQTTTTTAAT